MGFSQVIAFTLTFMIALSIGLYFFAIYSKDQQVYNYYYEQQQKLFLAQLQTKITINSVSVSNNVLSVTVANNGSTAIWDYSHFDVIVQYYANVSGSEVFYLSNYVYSPTQQPYTWYVNQELYPTSSVTLHIYLPYPPYSNSPAVVVISTNYGPEAVWRGII
ncbi:MAG: flagellar protein F [Sulfolobaceae archaeon]|nr:flagellar protein F [Sulfolobaceae archaeon]